MIKGNEFNWLSLDRHNLINMVLLCHNEIVNKPLPTKELYSILSKHIKTYLPIKTIRKQASKIKRGYVYIGGAYYSDLDQQHKKCVEITIQTNSLDEIICIKHGRFKRIATLIADTILHEIIHMHQYRSRAFKDPIIYVSTAERRDQRNDQNYFGNIDEIDAHSFNIACELHDKFKGDTKKIEEYINFPKCVTKSTKTNTWLTYLYVFNNNPTHKVIKSVKKKILKYLPNASQGKPYKNSKWLKK